MNNQTMQALICASHGLPESLTVGAMPMPEPGPGEVVIRMQAAGLNFPDTLIIQDKYQMKPALPFAPGCEMAGTVAAVGEGVTTLRPGDRVAALTNWGSFAEYVRAEVDSVSVVPPTMELDIAGGFTMVYGTSYYALKQRGQLRPSETVLVLGASGGVGLAAVEIAKAMGARVIAAASTAEKLAVAQQHGADFLVNYREQDLKASVKALTAGKGVDVIYDPVGDSLADPAFRTIAWGGRYLVIGFAGGQIPAIPLNLPLVKGASIVGVFFGEFLARTPALHRANMAELYAMHARGALNPLISARYPLGDSAAAIRFIMDRKAMGKVLVVAGN